MTTLQELEEIKELVNKDKHFKYKAIVNFNCENIEKELKALEIIKKKTVDIWLIQNKKTLKQYNSMVDESRQLTEEEFELLKEVLE